MMENDVSNLMNNEMSFDDIRGVTKRQIEAFEHWSRRIINDFFSRDYSPNYLDAEVSSGQPLVKAEIRKRIRDRKMENPGRYPRDIDAILIEDLEYFFTREDLYQKYFKKVFENGFSGTMEIRRLLEKLSGIRNRLYHDNPISIRDAEQAICYTNDFIDSFKKYYQNEGKEKEYNVPLFLSLSDSLGNRSFREDFDNGWEVWNISKERKERYGDIDNYRDAIVTYFRSGDHYELIIDVDSSFSPDQYKIVWEMKIAYKTEVKGEGPIIKIDFTDEMVSFRPEIEIKLITNKKWHRFGNINCDDYVKISLSEIFPPIEDTY